MSFTLTEEQQALRDLVRTACGDQVRNRAVNEGGEPGDAELWDAMVGAGLLTLGIREDIGGAGGGVVDQSIVAQELGRVASPAPFVTSTMLAGHLLAVAGAADEVAAMATGARFASVLERPGDRTMTDGAVTGTARLVIDGATADRLVVAGTRDGEVAIGVLDAGAAQVEAQPAVDRGRPLATVTLEEAPVNLLLAPPGGWEPVIDGAVRRGAVGLAAESAGLAKQCLELARQHALTRKQFGEIIGQFQAIKHKLADMLVLAENAVAAVQLGAFALDGNGDDVELSVAAAKATATDAAVRLVGDAMQVHGGIAITWEHDLHLYLRRAKTNQQLLGEPSDHRERIAARLLERAA